jgi:hypothetical protein
MCVLRIFKTKSVIEKQRLYRSQYGKVATSDSVIPFGDGYSVMKQRFKYKGGYLVITAEHGDQKTLTQFEKSKEIL